MAPRASLGPSTSGVPPTDPAVRSPDPRQRLPEVREAARRNLAGILAGLRADEAEIGERPAEWDAAAP